VILNIFWMFYRTCGSSSWLLLKMKVTNSEMAVVWTYKLYIAGPLSCVLRQHTIHIVGEKVISLLVDLWLPSVTYSSSVAWNSEVLQIFTVVSGINSRLLFVSHALISLVPDRGPLNGCVCVCVWLTQFFEWHFLHQFHRLTTLIIHHPFTLSVQA